MIKRNLVSSKKEQIPSQLADYIAFLEKELEVPITVVSVGPDRKQTIIRSSINA